MAWTYVGNLGPVSTPPLTYTRPADWLTLPTLSAGQQKLVGLYAVFNHSSNYVAFTAAGNYTVDWGDGSATEDIATGVQANHNYVYANVSGDSSRGYRQAVITITPQSGQTLTSINLNKLHSQLRLSAYCTGWLDLKMVGASVTSLTIGAQSPIVRLDMLEQFEYVGPSAVTDFSYMFYVNKTIRAVKGTEWTKVGTNFQSMFGQAVGLLFVDALDITAATSCANMFIHCYGIPVAPALSATATTVSCDFTQAFLNCYAMETVPVMSALGKATTLSSTFYNCMALRNVADQNTAKATNLYQVFGLCKALRKAPMLNTSQATNLGGAFIDCTALREMPTWDTSKVTDFNTMFQGCIALDTIPLLNTSAGTGAGFSQMFNGCSNLRSIPLIDTSKATSLNTTFQNCATLQTIPLLNTASVTNMGSAFSGCTSLTTIPLLSLSSNTSLNSTFTNCSNLQTVPALVCNAVTNYVSCFSGCYSLARCDIRGVHGVAISYANCRLSAVSLNEIYTNLGTGGGFTITVTNNPGTDADTPSIASGKGWSVTGS